jgi:hypothetical protein
MKMVHDSIHHPLILESENVVSVTATTADVAEWAFAQLFSLIDKSSIFIQAFNNAQGYLVPDPNVPTLTVAESLAFKVHVLSAVMDFHFTNTSEATMHFTIYEMIPRNDKVSTQRSPVSALSENTVGDFTVSGFTGLTFDDIRFTPYKSPEFVMHYKIVSVKKFTLTPGATTSISVVQNNVQLTNYLDNENIFSTAAYSHRRGVFKGIYIKTVGAEATRVDTGQIRTAQVHYRLRRRTRYEFRPGMETRRINATVNHVPITGGVDQVINERIGVKEIVDLI